MMAIDPSGMEEEHYTCVNGYYQDQHGRRLKNSVTGGDVPCSDVVGGGGGGGQASGGDPFGGGVLSSNGSEHGGGGGAASQPPKKQCDSTVHNVGIVATVLAEASDGTYYLAPGGVRLLTQSPGAIANADAAAGAAEFGSKWFGLIGFAAQAIEYGSASSHDYYSKAKLALAGTGTALAFTPETGGGSLIGAGINGGLTLNDLMDAALSPFKELSDAIEAPGLAKQTQAQQAAQQAGVGCFP